MAYTLAPFNPLTPYQNQVVTELNTANNNFTILGQAFYNNDPSSNPVLRASYVGSSAPSNPVAGMTWLDTSTTPPVLKVYDGSNWKSNVANANTVNNFPASLTPASNTIVPLNSSGILDLSSSYIKSSVYTIRRVDGGSLTSDYNLSVGEEAFYSWDTTASTSLNLHIASNGGIYQIIINGQYNTSADIGMYLYPNNTTYSNGFTYSYVYVIDTSNSVSGGYNTASYIPLSYLGSGGLGNIICSTYTNRKFLIVDLRTTYKDDGGKSMFITYRWSDTSTTWSSLGTLKVDSANGIIYVLVRRLA